MTGITDLAAGLYLASSLGHARREPIAAALPVTDPADEGRATARFFVLADMRDWAGDGPARYATMLVFAGAAGHAICRAAASAGLPASITPSPHYYVTAAAREAGYAARHLLTVTVREARL